MRHEVVLTEIPCATESYSTEIIFKTQNTPWLALTVPRAGPRWSLRERGARDVKQADVAPL